MKTRASSLRYRFLDFETERRGYMYIHSLQLRYILLSSSLSLFFLSFFLLPNYCRYVLHKMTSYHDRQTSKEEIVNIRLLRPHKEYLPPLPDALQLLVGQSSRLTLAVHGDGVQLIKAGRHEEISQVVFLSCQRILALRARG